MGNNTHPGSKGAPPRPRHSRPARTAILAYVAIMLTLYACFRVFMLLNNESLPAGSNTLPTGSTEEESSLKVIEGMAMNLDKQ
jgi:hypothetical protein